MEGGAVGHNFEMGLPKVYIGWKLQLKFELILTYTKAAMDN
jgi:hypothetical protein